MKQEQCPICANNDAAVFFQWENAIVHQQMLMPTDRQARQVGRGDIELAFCRCCGLIWNTVFDHQLLEYSTSYEASQTLSPTFQEYVEDIVKYLISKYDLRSKEILEIGCGDGFFLRLLCQLGQNRGTGFDPGWGRNDEDNVPENITYISDYYSEKYANYQGDLVCCRHVLEHIQNPVEFVRELAHLTQLRQPVFFFEIPNVSWSLRQLAFWDIYYEHCMYFSRASLGYLFPVCGFDVLEIREGFGGQYVWIESRYQPQQLKSLEGGASKEIHELTKEVEAFSIRYKSMMDSWRQEIATVVRNRYRVAFWGAGGKGVAFLNLLDIQPEQVEFVVDINPKKQGTYVPGTGQKIVAPEFLSQYKPDVVLVMNPGYISEIRDIMINMRISPELRVVGIGTERLFEQDARRFLRKPN